jgi:excisionase family DNA binding protein
MPRACPLGTARVLGVEDVAADEQTPDDVFGEAFQRPFEELSVFVIPGVVVEGVAQVPVGGVQKSHVSPFFPCFPQSTRGVRQPLSYPLPQYGPVGRSSQVKPTGLSRLRVARSRRTCERRGNLRSEQRALETITSHWVESRSLKPQATIHMSACLGQPRRTRYGWIQIEPNKSKFSLDLDGPLRYPSLGGLGHVLEGLRVQDRWLSVEEIAEYLGVSRDAIYSWVGKTGIPAHKVGRLWKFKTAEIDEWVRQSKQMSRKGTDDQPIDGGKGPE